MWSIHNSWSNTSEKCLSEGKRVINLSLEIRFTLGPSFCLNISSSLSCHRYFIISTFHYLAIRILYYTNWIHWIFRVLKLTLILLLSWLFFLKAFIIYTSHLNFYSKIIIKYFHFSGQFRMNYDIINLKINLKSCF